MNNSLRDSIKKPETQVKIFDLTLIGTPRIQVIKRLKQQLVYQAKQPIALVTTINPEQVMIAASNDRFRHIVNHSWALVDGVGLSWAISKLTNQVVETSPGVEVAEALLTTVAEKNLKVAIVGGQYYKDDEQAKLKSRLSSEFGIEPAQVFYTPGFADIVHPSDQETKHLRALLEKAKPDLVLVAFGAPYQEYWMWQEREFLEGIGVRLVMVVGGAVDVWSGRVRRAPILLRQLGLEWLWRLFSQPWRFGRQLKLLGFVGKVLLTQRPTDNS